MLHKTLPLLLVAILVSAGALAGCGESEEEKATAQVCTARDDIANQVKELEGLTITTATTSQVSDGLQAIRKDLTTISDARADLSDERRSEVEQANDAFVQTVRATAANVGKTTSIQDAATELEAALRQLATSYRGSFGQIDCP
jgi:hypothetical protein